MKKVLIGLILAAFCIMANTFSVWADLAPIGPKETVRSLDLPQVLLIAGIIAFVVGVAIVIALIVNNNKEKQY